MRNERLLSAQDAALLIIDVQESFRKQLKDLDLLTRNITILAEAAKILKVPVLITEQYPQGLGKTIAEISACLGEHRLFDKTAFSCCQASGFMDELAQSGRKQVIVCGIEAHVCVLQSVRDALERGYQVQVPYDAVASRDPRARDVALELMARQGAVITTSESVVFELLGDARSEHFKALSARVKALPLR